MIVFLVVNKKIHAIYGIYDSYEQAYKVIEKFPSIKKDTEIWSFSLNNGAIGAVLEFPIK